MSYRALKKSDADDFLGRFREVISDPLNLLIFRVPEAGFVSNGRVCLHNGLKVPCEGEQAYYGKFSDLLVINRGVHEPLEEFVFSVILPTLSEDPHMLELGSYWGHYSMWLKHRFNGAYVHLVEPDLQNLNVGKANFEQNKLNGHFEQAFVSRGKFEVDAYIKRAGISQLDILHADIQGYEVEMLEGAKDALSRGVVRRLLISTHSGNLHKEVINILNEFGYRVEVSSDFDNETTAFDGFIYATHSSVEPLFLNWQPMTRCSISNSGLAELVDYLAASYAISKSSLLWRDAN